MKRLFSLGSAWQAQQAGVEHAIKARHEIFDNNGDFNKIILTTNHVESLSDKFVSMIEYFQGKPAKIEDLIELSYDNLTEITNNNDYFYIDNNGNKQFSIHEDVLGKIILKYNNNGQIIKYLYTNRGYLQMTIDHLTYYYNNNKQVVLIHDSIADNYQLINGLKIYNYTLIEIIAHFLNEYLQKDDILIFDRTDKIESLPKLLKDDIKKILIMHNNHVASNDIHNTRQMNGFYTYMLSNHKMFDEIITSTQEQANDINKRFNSNAKCIPVGYIDEKQLETTSEIKEKDRFKNSAVMFSRIASDKQIHLVIEAYSKVIKKHPDAILAVYGFANVEQDGTKLGLNLVNEMIEKYGIQNNIIIQDYISDRNKINDIERHASLYLLGSSAEGFNLGLMEGLGNGLVGVSTDTKYGPNELISNEKTGYVVEYNNFDELADKIIKLYDDNELIEKFRQESINRMKNNYSKSVISKKWKDLVNNI